MRRGLFITFEGGEGTGKTTQIRRLARWLQQRGKKVVVTREPGGTPFADWIRRILLDPKNRGMDPFLELLLYESARKDHVEKRVAPSLRSGAIVLCDRFTDATLAYQGFGRRLPLPLIESLNRSVTGGLRPRLTFLLDLPPSLGLKRVKERASDLVRASDQQARGGNSRLRRGPPLKDRLENEAAGFHRRVRSGYLTLAREQQRRFRLIDTRRPKDQVFGTIVEAVKKVL